MADNPINMNESETGSGSALAAIDSPDERADLPEELTDFDDLEDDSADLDDLQDEPTEIGDDDAGRNGGLGTGAVSGGFGFGGLALAIVSLTTNWTSGVVISHGQYSAEMHAPSSGLTVQQELNLYASGWHTQGWWALVFAVAAVLFGAGALLSPRVLRSGGNPGWARAAATGAVIVGLVGALLAVLTIIGVFGGHLTAPASGT
jgi:hypothetical protein